jgi:uncharacterized membrane protein YkvA (DUF1232 family)
VLLRVAEDRVVLENFKKRISHLKSETRILYLAARHPQTPWYAKLLVAGIVAYALSPIDLIPDFVPVLGYLDDLVLIPLGIAIAIRLIPPSVLAECRARAQSTAAVAGLTSRIAAAVIVGIWLLLAALGALWAYHAFAQSNRPALRHGL